jgi:hypothetical protein
MVTVSPFAAPIELDTVTVPVPGVPAPDDKVSVNVFEVSPFPMVIVWPEVGPVPENVPAAVAPVMLVVRVNVLGLLPSELVSAMVGAVVDVGTADTVPITEAVVALVLRLSALEPFVIVTL